MVFFVGVISGFSGVSLFLLGWVRLFHHVLGLKTRYYVTHTEDTNMRTKKPFKMTFKLNKNLSIHLKREHLLAGKILDAHLGLHFNFIPKLNSTFSYLGAPDENLFIPKLYAALECLTGPSDLCFDKNTGSFSFTFLLTVQKNGHESQYIYHLFHKHFDIEFGIFHLVAKDIPIENQAFNQPNSELFSTLDMCAFNLHFYRYCMNYITISA